MIDKLKEHKYKSSIGAVILALSGTFGSDLAVAVDNVNEVLKSGESIKELRLESTRTKEQITDLKNNQEKNTESLERLEESVDKVGDSLDNLTRLLLERRL